MLVILWFFEAFIVLHWRLADGRLNAAVERGGVPLRALATVSRPAVGVQGTIGIAVMVIVILVGRHGQKRSSLVRRRLGLASSSVGENQGQEALRADDPGGNPSNLMVGVVLVQIRGLAVVDDSKKQAERIGQQEEELGGQREFRARNAEHDR